MIKNSDIAVVIPAYSADLTDTELISLKLCSKYLKFYTTYIVCPENLELTLYRQNLDFEIKKFAPKHFFSIKAYSQLLLSPHFYKAFKKYKYILIYQLDALVFKDELKYWCSTNYAYIGAPWRNPEFMKQWDKKLGLQVSKYLPKVGNGGLSLRNVKKHYWHSFFFKPVTFFLKENEDIIWCNFIAKLSPFYNLPSVKVASKFAFETNPSEMFKENGNELPFGTHAWEKNEPDFWRDIIDKHLA